MVELAVMYGAATATEVAYYASKSSTERRCVTSTDNRPLWDVEIPSSVGWLLDQAAIFARANFVYFFIIKTQ